jgi:hypothetical protein
VEETHLITFSCFFSNLQKFCQRFRKKYLIVSSLPPIGLQLRTLKNNNHHLSRAFFGSLNNSISLTKKAFSQIIKILKRVFSDIVLWKIFPLELMDAKFMLICFCSCSRRNLHINFDICRHDALCVLADDE